MKSSRVGRAPASHATAPCGEEGGVVKRRLPYRANDPRSVATLSMNAGAPLSPR